MKRLLTLLTIALLFAPQFAQAALVATYQGTVSANYGPYAGTPPMFKNVPLGTEYSTRRALFIITGGPSYFTPTDIQVASTSVGSNHVYYTGSGAPIGSFSGMIVYAWMDIPTGTTTNVDLVGNNSTINGSGNWNLFVYTFDSTLASTSPVTHKTNTPAYATSASDAIATDANGFMISTIRTAYHVTLTGLSISSSDETLTSDFNAQSGNGYVGVASKVSGTTARASSNVTWTWTATTTQALVTSIFWGPASGGGGGGGTSTPWWMQIINDLIGGSWFD